eukprot:166642-Chlamydomonas_euryale.AAC.1
MVRVATGRGPKGWRGVTSGGQGVPEGARGVPSGGQGVPEGARGVPSEGGGGEEGTLWRNFHLYELDDHKRNDHVRHDARHAQRACQ